MSEPKSKSTSPESISAELEIKRRGRRRLIGAATLGLLAIVFLPMIFDSEPRITGTDSKEISITVPPLEGQPPLLPPVLLPTTSAAQTAETQASNKEPLPPVVADAETAPAPVAAANPRLSTTQPAPSASVPLKTTPKAIAAPVVATVPALTPPPLKATPKPPAPKAAVPAKAATVNAPSSKAETTSKSAAPATLGFAVQLGAFSDEANVKQLIAKMKAAKLPVHSEKIAVAAGTVTRIRVGPYATREKAEQALAQIKKTGSDGKVVPL